MSIRRLLGPTVLAGDDLLGMAPRTAHVEAWTDMVDHHRPTSQPSRAHGSIRRDALRVIVVIAAIVALVLTSSAMNWVTEARAASADAKKAVIVAGPVHGLTQRYKDYAAAIASAAEAQGMDVVRIFHPNATKARVKTHANGADLFVYVGHGNGWPSPYPPFQETTKNGLGLNYDDPDKRGPGDVLYKGADWLREHIEFAPNAVVILSHLSYASGNASSGMPIPSRSVAVERIDNFANGFLSSGARVVWALGWQPGADVVDALHTEDATMDAVFMTRYREDANPLNGWIGHDPGYYESVRVPGAQVHIDPDPTYGYLRGITGDLSFTTTQWRDASAVPADLDAPVIAELGVTQAAVTLATADSTIPVFTPNGDGISDSVIIRHRLSENAFVEMRVKKDGKLVRRTSTWALRGKGSLAWNGRRDDGGYVGEGQFKIILTPTDRAGNRGEPQEIKVKVLSSMKAPTASPPLFFAADGDSLARTSTLKAKVTRDATVSLVIRDKSGKVVRRGIDAEAFTPGDARFVWDGTDDAGDMVPEDRYTARFKVQRPQGTYAHDVTVRMTSFKLWTPKWSLKRGQQVTLTFESAEPLKGKPVVTANQPGIRKYTVPGRKIIKISDRKFKVVLKTKAKGKAGDMKVRIVGTDKAGGSQDRIFTLKLR